MALLPVLSIGEDASAFTEDTTDKTKEKKTEAGYRITRPKFTRAPRLIFTSGYQKLTNEDKATLQAFYREHGGYKAFEYVHPVDGTVHSVRFIGTLKFQYMGIGEWQRWALPSFTMEEV
tara:strand:+ start:303 stop:659 length:357 start_codon:yes stop_codon:yes gene_type:complete